MLPLETVQTAPLTLWEDGSIRVGSSRVTLDSVVHEFIQGATDELGQVILRKILSLGLGLQLEVPFANAPAQRLDPRPILRLSPNSPGFLFAA